MIQALVEFGADINIPDMNGLTAIFTAAQSENLEIFKYLIEKGAHINLSEEQKKVILEKYGERGKRALSVMEKYHANVEVKND